MLIALIGNSAQSILSFRASLVRRLIERGHTVQAFAPDYTSHSRVAVKALGAEPIDFKLQRSGTNPLVDAWTIFDLRRQFRRTRPDAVLCYFMKPAIYGTIAATLSKIPRRIVILEGLGYGFSDSIDRSLYRKILTGAMKALLRFSLKHADQTLVLNDEDRQVVTEDVGIPRKLVTNMGGIGVELDQFTPAPVSEHAQVFALAARLIAEKGVHQYVEAARIIKRQHSNTTFLLLGEVDDNPTSLRTDDVAAWVAEGIIEWPGRVSNIQDWLKRCDVFVLPSYYREGVPRSIQEAMALGRAIVTTDHVGCRDTVREGVNGYLVPIHDVHQLVQSLIKLIETPGLAMRMGSASREMAEELFDAKRVDELLIKLLTC